MSLVVMRCQPLRRALSLQGRIIRSIKCFQWNPL
ncbi:C4-dicarboxylate ABC transporter [Vibrio cholerae]|uniref:C4-dicarboxylate ABC transporter n=1 Tax=Vibrio cholerae TaxID=666 RepID=A0ABD7SNJ3_VIBCL|nr:C4-dicarboxylate ABC transporter [Vibrio cholerae]